MNEEFLLQMIEQKGMTTQVGTCMTALMLARLLDWMKEERKKDEKTVK